MLSECHSTLCTGVSTDHTQWNLHQLTLFNGTQWMRVGLFWLTPLPNYSWQRTLMLQLVGRNLFECLPAAPLS